MSDAPWTAGRAYPRAAARWLTADGPFQAEIRNRWDDGSIKFAVCSALGPVVISPTDDPPPESAPVPEPSAAWLAANVVVRITGHGAGEYRPVPAASHWDRRIAHRRAARPGPVMSEFRYYVPTTDEHLALWFTVRAYANGSTEIETVVENGWLNLPGSSDRQYGIEIEIGGRIVFESEAIGFRLWHAPVRVDSRTLRFPAMSLKGHFVDGREIDVDGQRCVVIAKAYTGGGTNVTVDRDLPETVTAIDILGHVHHTRWSRVDWIGPHGDPQPGRLADSGLLPAYYDADGLPSERVLNGLPVPELWERGLYPRSMGAPGSNAEPVHPAAVFYVKTGDPRAYRSTVAHGHAAGRYAIFYRDETTGEPALYANYPRHAYNGSASGFTSTGLATGTAKFPCGGIAPPSYAKSHAPQLALVPYLLEGRESFRETVEFQAQVAHWVTSLAVNRFEGERIANAGSSVFQVRGAAWAVRSMMEALICLPDDDPRAGQYAAQLGKTLAYYDANFTGRNAFGMVQPDTGYSGGTLAFTASASFQQHMLSISCAWALAVVGHRLAPEARSRADSFVRWRLGHVVGLNGADWCWRYAAVYAPVYAIGNVANVTAHTPDEFNAACLPSWAAAFEATARLKPSELPAPQPCEASNLLMRTGSAIPSYMTWDAGSWWAINHAALAFAVNYDVPGAREAWSRFTGADNYDPDGFRNLPDWGIVPWH